MANWAKLQEQLTGLPVVKRAKHSIHFAKGDGQIVANFSGKPCHYEENGIWKPIDTTLLLGADGFYGCPHSPVKVHKDGRVKVDKSNYSQFTKLPGSPIGKVDGDKIVREFPGGYQELFVTEDGFREVITVVKPTFPIEKFIGKQTGTLPSAYKSSPQTAVDANGDMFEITSDTKAFGNWLDKAAYPVTIDPDFSIGETTFGDTTLSEGLPTRNFGAASYLDLRSNSNRVLMRFDLSSITGTCTAASLILVKTSSNIGAQASTLNVYSISAANSSWIEGTGSGGRDADYGEPCHDALAGDGSGGVLTDWAGSAGLRTSGTDYEESALASISVNRNLAQYATRTIDFNATGIARVTNWFGATNTNYGIVLNVTPNGVDYYGSSEHTTESYRPVLSVTYTAAGGVPKHFLHYARLRSN